MEKSLPLNGPSGSHTLSRPENSIDCGRGLFQVCMTSSGGKAVLTVIVRGNVFGFKLNFTFK
jgi:hypothetical protein